MTDTDVYGPEDIVTRVLDDALAESDICPDCRRGIAGEAIAALRAEGYHFAKEIAADG